MTWGKTRIGSSYREFELPRVKWRKSRGNRFWLSYREVRVSKGIYQKMAILQNTVTRLRIIVFNESHGAYHQRDILDLSVWNLYLLVLRRKRRRFCKIQLNVSESSFSAGLMVVMIKTTFWSSHHSCQKLLHRTVKSPLKPIKTQKMANLENTLRYIQIIF